MPRRSEPRSHLLDVYDCWLHVATTRAQFDQLRAKYELADIESVGATYVFTDSTKSNQPHVAIWIDTLMLDEPGLVNTIAHEATHAAAGLLDHIEQKADRHDSEALAYLVGWIAQWLWLGCD